MTYLTTTQIVQNALAAHVVVPAFNIPYLPMIEPVVRALRDTNAFGLIQVARLEWIKFQSKSLRAVRDEYQKHADPAHTRLHLDHIPVIDEDNLTVDFESIIAEAIELGYESVMVDGSRLPLEQNIAATKKVTYLAHQAGIPAEAELGAVLGHESGPMPPYEELFASGQGFTDPDQARQFVEQTQVDWLSVAVGNIHGAISPAGRDKKKIHARLSIEHLDRIQKTTNVPLVLHGGSGIKKDTLLQAFKYGIAKINIGTTIRQAYEIGLQTSKQNAQDAVYQTTVELITNELQIADKAYIINPAE